MTIVDSDGGLASSEYTPRVNARERELARLVLLYSAYRILHKRKIISLFIADSLSLCILINHFSIYIFFYVVNNAENYKSS